MINDFIAYLLAILFGGLLLVVYFSNDNNKKAQVAMTAMKQGYCSSAHPNNISIVIWNKCKEEDNE